jgi:hypothetical protein
VIQILKVLGVLLLENTLTRYVAPGVRPAALRTGLLRIQFGAGARVPAQFVKSWILGWLPIIPPDNVIVGLVLFATKLYHLSFLFAAPHAFTNAVYVAPTNVPAVLKQPGAEVIGVGVAQKLFCANEYRGNKKLRVNTHTIERIRWCRGVFIKLDSN